MQTYENPYDYFFEQAATITSSLLIKGGVYPSKNGFHYIVHAVDLLMRSDENISLREIYLRISNFYGVSAKTVASAINYSIKDLSSDLSNDIFTDMGINPNGRALTSKDFVYLIHDYVLKIAYREYANIKPLPRKSVEAAYIRFSKKNL